MTIQGFTKEDKYEIKDMSLQGYIPEMADSTFFSACKECGADPLTDAIEDFKGYKNEAVFTVDGVVFTIYDRHGLYRFGTNRTNRDKVGKAIETVLGLEVKYL
ncbi:hypothetical protein H8D29_03570 [PVC group bacterium]|nr:hypothetical protein [PVC group bacterium]